MIIFVMWSVAFIGVVEIVQTNVVYFEIIIINWSIFHFLPSTYTYVTPTGPFSEKISLDWRDMETMQLCVQLEVVTSVYLASLRKHGFH
jgi:hypothetical protein